MRKKLACGIGADHFKAIGSTIVFLDEAEIMESRAYGKAIRGRTSSRGILLERRRKRTRVGMVEEHSYWSRGSRSVASRVRTLSERCLNTVALNC